MPNLDLVVHAELPKTHETLLHRSGRTGRAGRKGVSALVVVPSSRKKAERILTLAKLAADWGAAPSAEDVTERDTARMFASDDWQTEIADSERASVDQLVAQFTPEQIAAAYLRQYKTRHSAPEELGDVKAEAPKPRAAFGPSVWFSVSEGRNQNASPRHLLPMLCKAGDITKDDIGAIRIADDLSYVEIRDTSVAGFLAAIGPEMKVEGSKEVVRLDKAPDLPAFERPKSNRGFKSKPRAAKTDTAPVDWNDAPTPRRRKPKPEDRKPAKPVNRQSKTEASDPSVHGPVRRRAPAAATEKGSSDTSKKTRSDTRKDGGSKPRSSAPKGPPPPKSKPNSKKNRARAAAAKAARGGNAVPKRRAK